MACRLASFSILSLLVSLVAVSVATAQAPPTPAALASYSALSDDFDHPVQITNSPEHPKELVIVERGGKVKLYSPASNSTKEIIDIEELIHPEQGSRLLSAAFYQPNRAAYLNYIDLNGDLIVARFKLGSQTAQSAESMHVVIKIARISPNKHGSQIATNRTGSLFISVGDGETKPAPQVAQAQTTLLGKVLRLDITPAERYAIPADNPFANKLPALPEIWALGFRNPDQLSYDQSTSRLFLADNRGSNYTIELIHKGVDYTNQSTGAKTTVASGSSSGRGAVIIAGIYSGKLIPELRGKLIFADSGSGEVFAAADRGTNPWPLQSVMRITSGVISALGFNSDGELFIGTESGEILAVYAN